GCGTLPNMLFRSCSALPHRLASGTKSPFVPASYKRSPTGCTQRARQLGDNTTSRKITKNISARATFFGSSQKEIESQELCLKAPFETLRQAPPGNQIR